jgi:hypothetical protein
MGALASPRQSDRRVAQGVKQLDRLEVCGKSAWNKTILNITRFDCRFLIVQPDF